MPTKEIEKELVPHIDEETHYKVPIGLLKAEAGRFLFILFYYLMDYYFWFFSKELLFSY